MTSAVRHRDTCRLCGSRDVELVLPLAPTPVADDYVGPARRAEKQESFPLDVWLCRACGHTQLLDVVDPDILFRDYTYRTSVSLGLVEHFRQAAASIIARSGFGPESLAVEIGSNDGSMLRFFAEAGGSVLGIDPAREIAKGATAAGIETLPEFFTAELGRRIRRERGEATVVVANNVFAHADDLGGIADGIREMLAREGVFVFEVSYMPDIVRKMLFDTVYHEHLCYHAVRPFVTFLRAHGMELFDVERIPTKGGSIRGWARRADGTRVVTPAVGEMLALEEREGFGRPEVYREFARKIAAAREATLELVDRIRGAGGVVAGYGASATVTTLLHHFDLGRRLDFIVDDNPVKQGTFSPGQHIPVVAPSALLERKPTAVLVLAWAYAAPIVKKNEAYLAGGGRFIVPLPTLSTIPPA
jgi:hypothetical protein